MVNIVFDVAVAVVGTFKTDKFSWAISICDVTVFVAVPVVLFLAVAFAASDTSALDGIGCNFEFVVVVGVFGTNTFPLFDIIVWDGVVVVVVVKKIEDEMPQKHKIEAVAQNNIVPATTPPRENITIFQYAKQQQQEREEEKEEFFSRYYAFFRCYYFFLTSLTLFFQKILVFRLIIS